MQRDERISQLTKAHLTYLHERRHRAEQKPMSATRAEQSAPVRTAIVRNLSSSSSDDTRVRDLGGQTSKVILRPYQPVQVRNSRQGYRDVII